MIDNPLPDQVMEEREALRKHKTLSSIVFIMQKKLLNTTKYMKTYMNTLQSGITIT